MILLGGDFVKGRRFEKSMPIEKIAPILAELHAPLGVYAVLGNHDWRRDGVRIADVLQKHGIEVLENENRRIDHAGGSLWLAGLADCNMRRPDVRKALENAGNPVLVITHSPDIFPQVLPVMSAEFQQFSMVPVLYPHIAPILSALPTLMFPLTMPRFPIVPEEQPKSP